jgi:hypothetical protein
MVFKIASTVVAMGSSVLQGNSKGPILNKPLLLKFGSLYLSANNTPKCYLCLFTGYIYADYPL